jgi:hypothetical protein
VNAKEAINAAKAAILDVMEGENVSDLGLEEISYNESRQIWSVTIGLRRPWDHRAAAGIVNALQLQAGPPRTYKVVEIADEDGRMIAIRNRTTQTSP